MGIYLSRCQVCVTEQLLHGPKVGSAFQQVRSVRVPEGVGVQRPPIGHRMAFQNAPSITRTEPSAPPIQENRTPELGQEVWLRTVQQARDVI